MYENMSDRVVVLQLPADEENLLLYFKERRVKLEKGREY